MKPKFKQGKDMDSVQSATYRRASYLTGLLVCLAGIFLLAWKLQSSILLNWDVSWMMHASTRLIKGGTYAKDFYEINPPLILYLLIPPVLIAKYFFLSIITALRIYVFLLSAISLCFCYPFLRKIFGSNKLLTAVFFWMLAFTFLVLPELEFGQRENLLIIFTMPYLLLITCKLQGENASRSLSITIGLMAAIGFAIKPYFLLTTTLIELYGLYATRRFFWWLRPEVITVLTFMIIYLISIFVFFPDYIHVVIPHVSNNYYAGFKENWNVLLFNPAMVLSALALLFYVTEYALNPYKIICNILSINLVAYAVAYLIQKTTFYYHVIPIVSMSVLLLTITFVTIVQDLRREKYLYILPAISGYLFFKYIFYTAKPIWTILVFQQSLFFAFFAGLIALILVTHRNHRSFVKVLICLVTIIGSSFLFSHYLLSTALWEHHFSLTLLFMLIMLGILVSKPLRVHSIFVGILGTLVLTFPIYYFYVIYEISLQKKENLQPIISYLQKNAYHKTVYFFTTTTTYEFSAVDYAEALSITRLAFLGWIPGVIKQQDIHNANQQRILRDKIYFTKIIENDIETKKPELIFVDVSIHKAHLEDINFDHLKFFLQDPEFQALWKSYKYLATIDNSPVYKFQVYQRTLN
jgi:hypothetical protein